MTDKLDSLEKRKSEPNVRLSGAAPSPVALHPNLAEFYWRKVETLQDSLNDPDAKSEAIEIIRSLIDRIILMLAESSFEVELVGKIANIVELAIGARKRKTKQPLLEKRTTRTRTVGGCAINSLRH